VNEQKGGADSGAANNTDIVIPLYDAVVLVLAKLCREMRNTNLDIEQLRTFVEVADAGGVSAAALRLGVSKSMVSRRLVRLEDDLGVQLLARTTRGAALTEEGSTFRDYAARICAEIDVARETILPAGELRGRLRVAAPLSFGPTHLAPVIAELARRHPLLQIQTCYSDQLVDLISEGYDCAIRLGYLQDSNLIARRVGPIYGKLVASPDYVEKHGSPEKPEDLASHQALMQGTEAWQFMDGEEIVTVNPRGRFKADNAVALVAAAVAGLGIAYLPDGLTDEYVVSGALLPLMTRHPPPPAGIYVVRPSAQYPARKVRVLTEMLIECFDHGAASDG
jgi:DNA-binding transcriptional LysR family regulator